MSSGGRRPSVLVIGAGVYVCGRGRSGFGTVLPTLVQAHAEGLIGELAVAATSPQGIAAVREKLAGLNARLGTRVALRTYPEGRSKDALAYRQALEELPRPACAVVVVPDHLHAPIAADVIKAGLHLLVVKPLAPTVAEASALIELAKARRVYGAVDFHKRFDEANLLARQALADGRLGELRHISVDYGQRRDIRGAFEGWIRHTNIFQYLGVHYVDLIAFLTGAQPVRVLATGQPRERAAQGLWQLDAIQAVIEWEGTGPGRTFTSTIATNWTEAERSSAMSTQAISLVGTRGRLDSDQKRRGVQLATEEGVEDPNPYFSQLYRSAGGEMSVEGYGPRSIRQFLRDVQSLLEEGCSIEELASTRPSFQQALVSTAVIEAVNKSLAAGEEWVDVGLETATPRASRRVRRAARSAPRETVVTSP